MTKFFGAIIKYSLILGAWIGVITIVFFGYQYSSLPTFEELQAKKPKQTTQINYSNNNTIITLGDLYDSQVTYDEIPKYLIDAVVATEDRRFFEHSGIDVFGIFRAFLVNIKSGKIKQGGSTITQQLVKLMFLTPERTFKRKIQEALLALKIERVFSKEQILTLYLNRAYFGSGNYGIVNASKYYFNKKVEKVNLNESAMLAGLLKAPSRLSPNNNKDLAQERANQVLINMIDAGYLGVDDVGKLDEDINYKSDKKQKLYFVDFVDQGFGEYIASDIRDRDNNFTIQTTLDEKIQNLTEDVVDSFVNANNKKLSGSQIAVVIMSKDGAVLAMIGGKDYQKSQFNRAVYSRRQPGSAFKTFIYLTAFQNGFSPDDIMNDEEIKIGSWEPKNYDNKYYGEVSLKEAFAKSMNSVAVKMSQQIDTGKIIKNAFKMGIMSKIDKDDPTIALGTMQVNLLELVAAYASIANEGNATMPYYLTKVSDRDSGVLYQRQSSGFGPIIPAKDIIEMKKLLREVVESGTGKRANVANNIYGKTGTSQDYRDAWFVGFDDDYVIGVWMGNDNNSPTNKITGGSLPAELFGKLMIAIN